MLGFQQEPVLVYLETSKTGNASPNASHCYRLQEKP